MRAELYPIPECPAGRLAIMPRPRAGDWLEDEAASWRQQGLDTVVSLLEDAEIAELGLGAEPELCVRAGLRFVRFAIPDRGVPAHASAVSELVSDLVAELRAGRGVGIHCRIGVGRSASLAVCVLAALGVPAEAGWAAVQRSRGLAVPDTPAQKVWVAGWVAGFGSAPPGPAA
ncbi:MAG TPA: hypothetical protein VGE74_19420 [Gemmata sp.]